jgi:hypothetical protein
VGRDRDRGARSSFREPLLRWHDEFVQIDHGDQISCGVDVHDGQGSSVWRMRARSSGLQVNERIRQFDLANDLQLLADSEANWHYGAQGMTGCTPRFHTKPGGWKGEIIRDVCKQFGVRLAKNGLYLTPTRGSSRCAAHRWTADQAVVKYKFRARFQFARRASCRCCR